MQKFLAGLQAFIDIFYALIQKGLRHSLLITKSDVELLRVPAIILFLALLLMFWMLIPLFVVLYFFGVRYRVEATR